MDTYLFVLGKNFSLSMAELNVFFNVTPIGLEIAEIKADLKNPQMLLNRLGGTIKIADAMGEFSKNKIVTILKETIRPVFGITSYVKGINVKKILTEIKKEIRKSRFITGKNDKLSSAQIIRTKSREFIIYRNKRGKISLAKTCAVQDIDFYSLRDYKKPVRDMRTGMIPPKLAQIMINLAQDSNKHKTINTIYDPFCGCGTILMEAMLMGYNIIGSDRDKKAIDASKKNILWLKEIIAQKSQYEHQSIKLFANDAVSPIRSDIKFSAIVTEPYLGPNYTKTPKISEIKKVASTLNNLYIKFFKTLKSFFCPVVIIFPFFRLPKNNIYLKNTAKTIETLGFLKTNKNRLYYKRPNSIVGREICVFRRKNGKNS